MNEVPHKTLSISSRLTKELSFKYLIAWAVAITKCWRRLLPFQNPPDSKITQIHQSGGGRGREWSCPLHSTPKTKVSNFKLEKVFIVIKVRNTSCLVGTGQNLLLCKYAKVIFKLNFPCEIIGK